MKWDNFEARGRFYLKQSVSEQQNFVLYRLIS